ncbi:IDEAL domain-containing protein [Aneurinibacillus tyrosinisolvens]|uniref:IDEAL domain-containing protein n=1 Tax=Aneurinibacillus tyrosinisolvens TaxID=1443435 RepID=UPI000AE3E0B4|nr:IDEAL domain-containing protein [Aneurinibacillus tyrosinisolvens]
MEKQQKPSIMNPSTLSLVAEMVLDEALRNYRLEKLYKEIDSALEAGDEKSFHTLTTELKGLLATKKVK